MLTQHFQPQKCFVVYVCGQILPILRVLILCGDEKPGANLYIQIKTNVCTKSKILGDLLFYREWIFPSEKMHPVGNFDHAKFC